MEDSSAIGPARVCSLSAPVTRAHLRRHRHSSGEPAGCSTLGADDKRGCPAEFDRALARCAEHGSNRKVRDLAASMARVQRLEIGEMNSARAQLGLPPVDVSDVEKAMRH